MKKSLLSCIFLLPLFLCSCINTLPAQTNTGEPTRTEVVLPESTSADEPIDEEAISIVFRGEKITAPGSYSDIPDLYAPVLDDLYLYGALLQRYSKLHYDGMATTEVLREFEQVQKEIKQRGRLPYTGYDTGTAGYTLIDLDGDNNPELLLLNDPTSYSYRKQIPDICAIYAIRSGQLVCIDNGSSELSMATILATDSIFYQCVDWSGAGYTYLSAFRLEPGMSEFTIISEARASLSFEECDVPVPYWVKTENGEEINITEEEFDMLFEQYKNPKDLMVLDFAPLHPDWVDPWSVPRPPEKSLLTEPIEHPQSYSGAPGAYNPILDDLYLFSEHVRLEDSFDYVWENFGALGFVEPPQGEIGYAVVDINNDGIPELLLGSIDGLNNASPHSVFTLKDGNPVLLISFWSRSRGVISANGAIYSVGSGGAAYTDLSSYRLDKHADTLTELTDIRSDYSFSEDKPYFFQIVDGKNHYISKDEFWNLSEMYKNPSTPMKLTVIPISN